MTFLLLRGHFEFTLCPKTVPVLDSYNFDLHQPNLITFGSLYFQILKY